MNNFLIHIAIFILSFSTLRADSGEVVTVEEDDLHCGNINPHSLLFHMNCSLEDIVYTTNYEFIEVTSTVYIDQQRTDIKAKVKISYSSNPWLGIGALIAADVVYLELVQYCDSEICEKNSSVAQELAGLAVDRLRDNLAYRFDETLGNTIAAIYEQRTSMAANLDDIIKLVQDWAIGKGIVEIRSRAGKLIGFVYFEVTTIEGTDMLSVAIEQMVEIVADNSLLSNDQEYAIGGYGDSPYLSPNPTVDTFLRNHFTYECRDVAVQGQVPGAISIQTACGYWPL